MDGHLQSSQIEAMVSQLSPLDIRVQLFKNKDFDFIVRGIASNNESDWKKGDNVVHKKQKKALEILTSNEYDQFLYGGAAGGSKSFTGMSWIVFSALAYPKTRYFIARNELKDIRDSVMITFSEVCDHYGIKDFHYNSLLNFIKFPNGSEINLIEVKYKPSDPEYKDVGSTLYTSGWFEEVGEIHEKAVSVLTTRVNRWNVDLYDLKGIVFMTGNPSKNWTKSKFYDKHRTGVLYEENKDERNFKKCYLGCLVTENPFISQRYIDSLRKQASNDKAIYERLFKGNWDYDDNPNQLADQECIDEIFDNDHVEEGKTYITADIARHGSDKAVIIAWSGWIAKEIITYDYSSIPTIVGSIKFLKNKYKVPNTRTLVDADGIGASVLDYVGSRGFKNGARPIGKGKDTPNYRNLQVQCLFLLAEKINQGQLYIEADITDKDRFQIKEELSQIIRVPSKRDDEKLDCKRKGDIKSDIGRSPDFRDAIFMRVFFDIKKTTADLTTTWN